MLHIISPENKGLFKKDLDNYFRIRKKILIDQLCWDLKSIEEKEIDQFDHDQAHYLLYKPSKNGKVMGGVRLTPSTAQNLTFNVFSNLIDPQKAFPPSPQVWECSRFVIDSTQEKIQATLINEATLMLFIGMIEYGLSYNVHSYIATTEVRLERVIRMAQWSFERLGKVEKIGNTYAVLGLLEVSKRINKRIRERAGIMGNVFWNEGTSTYEHL